MTCDNCLDNCDPLVTDRCTKYTGTDIVELGICKGMSLYEIDSIILSKLQVVSHSSNITLDALTTTCTFITNLLLSHPQPFTLQSFAETTFDALCRLDSKIAAMVALTPSFSFDVKCLQGDTSSKDKIIQSIINLSCVADCRLTALESSSVKQIDLCTQVKACVVASTPGVSTQFNLRMVPYTYMPYAGPLNNFDNTGKGLLSANFDKIFLANGLNGTQDWRGRSPIGAILNVPGVALDSVVDPTLPNNLPYNHTQGGKAGSSNVSLTLSQIPSHTHVLTDLGHTHDVDGISGGDNNDNNNTTRFSGGDKNQGETGFYFTNVGAAKIKTTGITIDSSGGGQSHTNLHPVIGCLYIVYIP